MLLPGRIVSPIEKVTWRLRGQSAAVWPFGKAKMLLTMTVLGSWLEMSGKGSDLVFEFYLSMLIGLCFDVLSYIINIYIYISSWEWAMCHELKKKGGSENWFRPRNRHGVPAGTCRTCQSDLHVFLKWRFRLSLRHILRCLAKRTIRSNRKGDWPHLLPQIRGTTPDSKQPPRTFPWIADNNPPDVAEKNKTMFLPQGCVHHHVFCFHAFFTYICGGSTKHHLFERCVSSKESRQLQCRPSGWLSFWTEGLQAGQVVTCSQATGMELMYK